MGFLSNLFGGKTSEAEQSATEDGRTAEASSQAAPVATVLCPVSGTVMDISEVNDPVFAGKAMGDGIAIVPSEGVLVAPISGTERPSVRLRRRWNSKGICAICRQIVSPMTSSVRTSTRARWNGGPRRYATV